MNTIILMNYQHKNEITMATERQQHLESLIPAVTTGGQQSTDDAVFGSFTLALTPRLIPA